MHLPIFRFESALARNVSYSVIANVVSFLVGVIVIALVPKALGVVEYGYFQLFVFFMGYSGFFHFGWVDGIVLRYAGARFEDLDRHLYAGQVRLYLLCDFTLWGTVALVSILSFGEDERLFVLLCTAGTATIMLFNGFLRLTLQATNRIKAYAFLILVERTVYLVAVLIVLFSGSRDFRFFVLSFTLGQAATLSGAIWFCRDLIFTSAAKFFAVCSEAIACLRCGSKLMLANIVSLLILGVVRFGIERVWGIATFGKISLILSVISILFVFVNAASVALLPALRREENEHFRAMYLPARTMLCWFLLICFVFAYPASEIFALWLPDYADALVYLPLILPLCLFESSVSLLTGTYLKVVRCERELLLGNVVALIVSAVLFAISVLVLKSLAFAVFSMTMALIVRSFVLEKFLRSKLGISAMPVFVTELIATVTYIVTACFVGGYVGTLFYLSFLVVAFVVSRRTFWKTPIPVFSRVFQREENRVRE